MKKVLPLLFLIIININISQAKPMDKMIRDMYWSKQQSSIKELYNCYLTEQIAECYQQAIIKLLDSEQSLFIYNISPSDNRIVSGSLGVIKSTKDYPRATLQLLINEFEKKSGLNVKPIIK